MPKFVIEKSAETTIFGKETEDLKAEQQNEVAGEPTLHAEEAGSSLIIASTPVGSETPSETLSDLAPVPAPETEVITASASLEETPIIEESISTTPSVLLVPTENVSLFEHLEEDSIPSVENTPINPEESPLFRNESTSVTEISVDPKAFIQKSLTEIDTMIANIETRHDAKVEETQKYAKEKERFAELEDRGYAAIDAIDAEKSHALHLREILEKELTGTKNSSDETSQVESTLSEIGKANPIVPESEMKKESSEKEEFIFAGA